MSKAKTSNHAKAPQCAAFVDSMRAAFGEVTVLYVKEKEFTLGAPSDEGVELASATAFDVQREKVLAKA
jgi:hypothetical protein